MAGAAAVVDGAGAPRGELDRGELVLSVRGRAVGRESFVIEGNEARRVIRSEVRFEWGSLLRLADSVLETDGAWRPLAATGRDVVDGGTRTELAGSPLVLTTTVRSAPVAVRTASREVELYLGENMLSHYAPTCALAAPAVRTGFPGMDVRIDGDRPTTIAGVTRRSVDLAGALRTVVTCEAGKLLAVEVPATGLVGVRAERQAELAGLLLPGASAVVADLGAEARAVPVAGAVLACEVVLPRGAVGATAAAVLLNGSGAQDRDENTVGPGGIKSGLMRAIAGALAERGVASIRCDDRGVGGSTGDFGAATRETFVADARAMLAALRAERRVDPARVAVVGHSEGALIAATVAAGDARVAAVAMLAGPGRPLDEVLLEQVARTLARGGLTADEAAAALDRHRAALAAVRAGTPLPDTAEAREWLGGEAWLRSHLVHDVAADLAALAGRPLLVAQGGVDRQVRDVDADRLIAAARAAGNGAVVDRRYPTLDHMFASSETGDPAAYVDPDRAIAPAMLADLAAFVAAAPARVALAPGPLSRPRRR